MYKHILYPTDGSPGSEKAFEHVLKMAVSFEAKVSILHVYQMALGVTQSFFRLPPEVREQALNNLSQDGDDLLKNIKERLLKRKVETLIYNVEGNTKTTICEFAIKHQADLIILGTRGAGSRNISGSVNHFGSTCSYLIHHTPGIPVMVID